MEEGTSPCKKIVTQSLSHLLESSRDSLVLIVVLVSLSKVSFKLYWMLFLTFCWIGRLFRGCCWRKKKACPDILWSDRARPSCSWKLAWPIWAMFVLWDMSKFTQHQPQTMSSWSHGQVRPSKSTTWFCLSTDKNEVLYNLRQCLPTILSPSDHCLLISLWLSLWSSELPLEITFIEIPHHRIACFLTVPNLEQTRFLRPLRNPPNQSPNPVIGSNTFLLRRPPGSPSLQWIMNPLCATTGVFLVGFGWKTSTCYWCPIYKGQYCPVNSGKLGSFRGDLTVTLGQFLNL